MKRRLFSGSASWWAPNSKPLDPPWVGSTLLSLNIKFEQGKHLRSLVALRFPTFVGPPRSTPAATNISVFGDDDRRL